MSILRRIAGSRIVLLGAAFTAPGSPLPASLHPGSLDSTFVAQRITARSSDIGSIVLEPGGGVVAGGSFVEVAGVVRRGIARFRSDGSRDDTFGAGVGAEGLVTSIVRVSGGKLLIGGRFELVDGVPRRNLARLDADGRLDPSFAVLEPGPSWVHCLHAMPNGGALVSESPDRLRLLNPDGTTDESFAPTHSGVVFAIARQPDGRILIGGYFWLVNGVVQHSVARLNADGTLDESFVGPGLDGPVDVFTLTVLPDGKILMGGRFEKFGDVRRMGVARLNSDGTLDSTFDSGEGTDQVVESLAVQPDGRILIGGSFSRYNGVFRDRLARLEADGAIDPLFVPGVYPGGSVRGLAVQADGMVVAGLANGVASAPALLRFEADGALDSSFVTEVRDSGVVENLAVQVDGKIVIGGRFDSVAGTDRNAVARLSPDGTLDATFDPGTGSGPIPDVQAVALQADGKVLVGGSFWSFGGLNRHFLARLETNGELDLGFGTSIGPNGTVAAIAIQPDDKVVIGGDFTTVDLVSRAGIARLNSDGTLDLSFDPGPGANGRVETVALQPDGRIVLGGWFTTVGSLARRGVARLHWDGSVDRSFDAPVIDGFVESLVRRDDGTFLIGGSFTMRSGEPGQRMARLELNGSPDPSFRPAAIDDTIKTVVVPSDGRAIVGGFFGVVDGLPYCAVARLEAGGELDQTFDAGMWSDEEVHAIAVADGGKVIVGGDFTTVGGVLSLGLARLHGIVHELSVDLSGQGTVTADSGAINCGAVCSDTYGNGELVTLSAEASPGFSFAGWSGEGCAGTGICQVVMDQARTVSAAFESLAGFDTPGIYRSTDRSWYLKNTNAPGAADLEFPYGDPSDLAVKGDWDGDGDDTVGIYRDGTFFLRNSNTAGPGELVFFFGAPGDIPIAGDWDGDGIDTIGVYRPGTAEWYLRNTNAQGDPDISFTYGLSSETPVVGDWDGDGTDTVGIFRASDRQWYLHNTNAGGNAELVFPYGDPAQDVPVVGDWDGDGDDTVGIYRTALGEWFLKNTNEAGNADVNFVYGLVDEKPLAGDWDGN